MKGLIDKNNRIIYEASNIIYGDLYNNMWTLYDVNDIPTLYTEDDHYSVIEYDEVDKPEDFSEGKYFYIDGEFVIDPEYGQTATAVKERLDDLAESLRAIDEDLSGRMTEIDVTVEEALCDSDETLNKRIDDIEEALCEIVEMMEEANNG